MSQIKINKYNLKSMKKRVFVTFSAKEYLLDKIFYSNFLKIVEECNFVIIHRWFEESLGKKKDPEIIFQDSVNAIVDADILIAEITKPSVGAGQQIAISIQQKKPVILCIHKKGVSQENYLFTRGMRSALKKVIYYYHWSDLKEKLIEVSSGLKLEAFEKFNFLANKKIKTTLQKVSRDKRISQSELLRNIVEDWIIENNLG